MTKKENIIYYTQNVLLCKKEKNNPCGFHVYDLFKY